MSNHSVSSNKDFGKDLGLIHEVIVTGRKAGADHEFWSKIAHNKNLFSKIVGLVERNGYEATTTQKYARDIMGKNYFGIEEAIKHFKVKPLKKHLKAFAEVPYTEEVLESCKKTHILVAVFPLSILDIRKVNNELFYLPTGGWYEGQKFAQNKGTAKWQLVRKTPVDDSTNKNWDEQQALLSDIDETPSAQIMVYTIIGHYMNTKERLFEKVYVRCSCVALDGNRVYVGVFDLGGLSVSYYWGARCNFRLGLSSAQKS